MCYGLVLWACVNLQKVYTIRVLLNFLLHNNSVSWIYNYTQCHVHFYVLGATGLTGAYFGSGSGPIHLDSVVCSGTEYNLTDCQVGKGTRQSSHSEGVGVKCQTSKDTMHTCMHLKLNPNGCLYHPVRSIGYIGMALVVSIKCEIVIFTFNMHSFGLLAASL